MAKKVPLAQLPLMFEDPPVTKAERLFNQAWRYPGDPDTPEGRAMPNWCKNRFAELGGLGCQMKTYGDYCDTCAFHKGVV